MRPGPLLLALALAGCLGATKEPAPTEATAPPSDSQCPSPATETGVLGEPGPVPLPVREGFESLRDEGIPLGWVAMEGRWGAVADSSSPEGLRSMRGEGDAVPGFSMLMATAGGALADFTAQVSFRMDCIQHPHGVGLAFHVEDLENYQIIRYSATESAWDIFTVKDGVRERHPLASTAPGTDPVPGVWATLRVTSDAGHIEAFDGAAKLIAYDLPAGHATAGQAGLFLRGTSSAFFDDFRLDDLGLPA